MKHIFHRITFVLLMTVAAAAQAADFTLHEQPGRTWTNERVTFPLTPTQAAQAAQDLAL